MNKSASVQPERNHQATKTNKINRNLSPSFARIQALSAKTQSSGLEINASHKNPKRDDTSHASEPQFVTPPAPRILHATTDHVAGERKKPPSISPARIAPWLIASITLTLALFSGNYAWHTQLNVEKLELRLQQLETLPSVPPTNNSLTLETSDAIVRTEQELLSLSQTQKQLVITIAALQTALDADTEQTNSRLTKLEDTLTAPPNLVRETASSKEAGESQMAQSSESEPSTKLALDTGSNETINSSTHHSATENWFINIASFSEPLAADSTLKKVNTIADNASIKTITIDGQTLYRIRANGYDSRAGAEREAQILQAQLKLSGLWVSRD